MEFSNQGKSRVRVEADTGRRKAEHAVAAVAAAATLLTAATPAEATTTANVEMVQNPFVLAHRNGAGTDLRVAVYEPRACIDRDHPDFSRVDFQPRIPSEDCDPTRSSLGVYAHATAVTSALASLRPDTVTFSGLFQGQIYDVDSLDARSWDEMIDRNPDFINISATTAPINAFDIDEAVYAHRIFVANAAGNDGGEEDDTARCIAYNSVCVGGYSHSNTLGPDAFFDDVAMGGSSWRNPPRSGREEPDLAGPWSHDLANVPSAGQPGYYRREGGTSYATPSVTGLAALMTAAHPETLFREPTLLRALLMASASHRPVEPGGRTAGVPNMRDGIDDRMGAGAPRGDRARDILFGRSGSGTWRSPIGRTASFDADRFLEEAISFEVEDESTVRVALAWDNCPQSMTEDRDQLTVDLDLTVRGPDHNPDLDPDERLETDPGTSGSGTQGGEAAGGEGETPPETEEPFLRHNVVLDAASRLFGWTASYPTSWTVRTPTPTTTPTTNYRGTVPTPTTPTRADGDPGTSSTSSSPDTHAGSSATESGVATGSVLRETIFENHSKVDNYEILEFVAPIGGTYSIEIHAPRWERCEYDGRYWTNAALAWDVSPPPSN